MTPWLFLHEPACPPSLAMARDLALFGAVRQRSIPGFLRVYNWSEPAVTVGHSQNSFSFHDSDLALPLLRRPTGGGAVLHVDDITFSISTPLGAAVPAGVLECSGLISKVFACALRQCGLETALRGGGHEFSPVCFARPSPVELVSGTGKVMGLALARRSGTVLAQGVIPLRVDRDLTRRVFGPGVLPECRGIVETCPDFALETFLAGLQESLAVHLGVSFQNSTETEHPEDGTRRQT